MTVPVQLTRREFMAALTAAVPLAQASLPPSPRVASQEEWLVAAIQDGNKVIYLRHAATVQSQIDTGRLNDRAGQRNLSQEGIRQAQQLGAALRALRVPLNTILASPVFRSRDTAEIAFGADNIDVTMDLVADEYAGNRLNDMLRGMKRLLETPLPPGENRVLVGHRTPLEMVTGRSFPDTVLPEGAMAVFLPGAKDQSFLLGTISAERVIQSARSRGAL